MRHQRAYRKFGRRPKHRKALFRNLATSLITHERIVTTLHKALSLRPWIEKLILKARQENQLKATRYTRSLLFTTPSMRKLHKEIAPRMDQLEIRAGFTKVIDMGRRDNTDRARMAMIEIMGNQLQVYEKQQEDIAREEFGRTYWGWELKLLQQEQQYFKDKLDVMQDEIDNELDQFVIGQTESSLNDQIKQDIEKKYDAKKTFLLSGLRRAIVEEEIHIKQQKFSRYTSMDRHYGQSDDFDIRTVIGDQFKNSRETL